MKNPDIFSAEEVQKSLEEESEAEKKSRLKSGVQEAEALVRFAKEDLEKIHEQLTHLQRTEPLEDDRLTPKAPWAKDRAHVLLKELVENENRIFDMEDKIKKLEAALSEMEGKE